jgi:hypothetical protein
MVATLLQLYNNATKQEKWYNRSGSAICWGISRTPIGFYPHFTDRGF